MLTVTYIQNELYFLLVNFFLCCVCTSASVHVPSRCSFLYSRAAVRVISSLSLSLLFLFIFIFNHSHLAALKMIYAPISLNYTLSVVFTYKYSHNSSSGWAQNERTSKYSTRNIYIHFNMHFECYCCYYNFNFINCVVFAVLCCAVCSVFDVFFYSLDSFFFAQFYCRFGSSPLWRGSS